MAETLVCVTVVIVTMQVVLRLFDHWGVPTGARLTPNFEGYAGNRNAFAFQLLAAAALLLGYFEVYARTGVAGQHVSRRWAAVALLAILWAALVWTGSRTGMVVGVVMLLIILFVRPAKAKLLCWSVVTAALLWVTVWLAAPDLPMQVYSAESSNQERWATIVHGFDLWLESPLVGAGLGVFNARSSTWFGYPQVIHSTPLWILAEFGLLGGAVFAWGLFVLGRYAVQFDKTLPAHRILLLLLSAFTIFGLAHEIFFQRIFWLVLGAVLAQPFSSRVSS
jgi:hypothetical protein